MKRTKKETEKKKINKLNGACVCDVWCVMCVRFFLCFQTEKDFIFLLVVPERLPLGAVAAVVGEDVVAVGAEVVVVSAVSAQSNSAALERMRRTPAV